MIYAAAFYGNLGNYKSFGDTKFVPDLPKVIISETVRLISLVTCWLYMVFHVNTHSGCDSIVSTKMLIFFLFIVFFFCLILNDFLYTWLTCSLEDWDSLIIIFMPPIYRQACFSLWVVKPYFAWIFKEKLQSIIFSSKAYEDDPKRMEQLWNACEDAMFSLNSRTQQLGLGEQVFKRFVNPPVLLLL